MDKNLQHKSIDRATIPVIFFLMVLSSSVLLYKLGAPFFYDVRLESRRAEIARNMLETEDWIIPHLSGEVKLSKPPLYFWAVALCSLKSGVNEFTARFPAAVCGVGTILTTFLLGSLLFSKTTGVRAALLLLVTNLFAAQARFAELDSMLTFFIIAAIFFYVRGYTASKPAISFRLFFIAMGLGMLTKGPFAFTFPLIPIGAHAFFYREQKTLMTGPFLSGIKYFFIMLLPWVLIVLWYFPGFLSLVVGETVARFYVEDYGHIEPFYYYLRALVPALFPWVFFLPLSLWMVCSDRLRSMRREHVFLLLWIFGNLLFLSFFKAKRDFYLTPLAPAAALLIGSTWESVWSRIREKLPYNAGTLQRACFVCGAVLAAVSLIAGNPFAIQFPGKRFPDSASFLLFAGLCCMIVSLIKAVIPAIPAAKTALAAIVSLALASQCCYLSLTVPVKNAYDSGTHFYRALPALVPAQTPLAFFGSYANYAMSFYAHRPVIYLTEQDKTRAYMAASEKRYLVLSDKFLKNFPDVKWKAVFKSMYSEHTAWGGYVLVSNQ